MHLFQSSWVLMPHPSTRDYGNALHFLCKCYILKYYDVKGIYSRVGHSKANKNSNFYKFFDM